MKTWQKLKQDPSLWPRYFIREQVIKAMRAFFDSQGFHEVETPILLSAPAAESYLEVFETTLLDRNRKPTKGYLSTSPEMALKKLLVAGIGDCYSLTKSFRNTESLSNTHNPEFTILEWYRVGVSYDVIMEDCEKLIIFIFEWLNKAFSKEIKQKFEFQGKNIDIFTKWERLTMKEAFARYAQIDFDDFLDEKNARSIAKAKGYQVEEKNTWEELYNQIFLNEVEPNLGHKKPVILYEFPGVLAALAKRKTTDPRYAERFEFYIAGLELGDCYGELVNPAEQESRFEQELTEIKRLGKTLYDYDHDFIDALKVGMSDASGIAIGVDRLVMLFANTTSIADTMFFPVADLFDQ